MLARTPKDIGALIRARRRELGLDQATLADRIGVSRQWIIEIERGKPGAAVGQILRTLQALGLRVEIDADGADAKPVKLTRLKRLPALPDIDAIVAAARKRP